MSRMFDRVASLIVDGVKVDGLRVVFKVAKNLEREPNTCEVKVYNLAERTRAGMKSKGAPVVLTAGYRDTASVIFSGDARTIDHVRESADWVTVVKCGDGERAYQFARVSESFAPGTPIADVIAKCAKQLGLNLGNLPDVISKGGFRGSLTQFAHGYTAHGRASTELDKLLRTVGLSWSVQNGAIQVLKGAEPDKGVAVLLTPETGLIGSPAHGNPDKKGGPSVLKARALLQPQIRCGGRIEIRAAAIKGQFRVEKLEHTGDTHGNDWYTSVEAKPAT